MRKLITTDNHLVPPPWLLDELPEQVPRQGDVFPSSNTKSGLTATTS